MTSRSSGWTPPRREPPSCCCTGPGTAPILVVGARRDTIFPPGDVEATAAAWGTTPVMVEDIAHDLMLDPGWGRVADLVADRVLARVSDAQRL